MHHLGHTRSANRADHLVSTPDTFIPAPLPGMRNATAIVHVNPARGAAFTQYSALLQADGELAPCAIQRFLYVLEGAVSVAGKVLDVGGYAYFPPGAASGVEARGPAKLAVIEKPYIALQNMAPPRTLLGKESDAAPQPILGDPDVEVRSLIGADPAFDFAVNTLTYQPGATLPMVEIHVMEHGLLMLEGSGIYRLSDCWYPVTAGDFIWMAPYCPQWFGALGKQPAKYLIYKDWNR